MMNFGNNFNHKNLSERKNIILKLGADTDQIKKNYSENTRRNIKKAEKQDFSVSWNFNMKEIMALFTANRGQKLNISEYWTNRVMTISHAMHHKGKGHCVSLYNVKNECIAGAFYVLHDKRLYFLFSGSDAEVKKHGAMHFLINQLIEKHNSSGILLDFEGSNNEGLARFYKSFGGIEQNYPMLNINRLPFYLSWLKK